MNRSSRAFRAACQTGGPLIPVSYTQLDVYKRQALAVMSLTACLLYTSMGFFLPLKKDDR
ncbi:hypothetical protein [Erwinia amylovora]